MRTYFEFIYESSNEEFEQIINSNHIGGLSSNYIMNCIVLLKKTDCLTKKIYN